MSGIYAKEIFSIRIDIDFINIDFYQKFYLKFKLNINVWTICMLPFQIAVIETFSVLVYYNIIVYVMLMKYEIQN